MSMQPSTQNDETSEQQQEGALSPEAAEQSQVASKPSARSSRRARKSASAFRTISEVADLLDVQQHVLRFWETKFSQVRPLKRGGGRRYYRPEDVDLLRSIHHLLYTEGYTIKGVQKLLREKGKNTVVQNNLPGGEVEQAAKSVSAPQPQAQVQSQAVSAPQHVENGLSAKNRETLENVLSELRELKGSLTSGE